MFRDESRIVYLITKNSSNDRFTIKNLNTTLYTVKNHMKINKIMKVAIPRNACGLGLLTWRQIKNILNEIFEMNKIEIFIYTLN